MTAYIVWYLSAVCVLSFKEKTTSPKWTGNDLNQSETCSHDSHAMARLPLFLFPLLSTNDKKLLLWLWQSGDVARVVPQLLITCYVFNDNFLLFKQQKVKISSFWFFFRRKAKRGQWRPSGTHSFNLHWMTGVSKERHIFFFRKQLCVFIIYAKMALARQADFSAVQHV